MTGKMASTGPASQVITHMQKSLLGKAPPTDGQGDEADRRRKPTATLASQVFAEYHRIKKRANLGEEATLKADKAQMS